MKKRLKSLKRSTLVTVVLFVVAVALLVGSAVGGTYAALTYYSENFHADFNMFDIGVTLLENNEPVAWRNYTGADDSWSEQTGELLKNMLAEGEELELGKHYPVSLAAQNSGSIDEYVRVRLFKYWEDKDGNRLTNLDPNNIELELSENGWMENPAESTTERTVLYYTSPLASGATSSEFLHAVTISKAVCNQVTERTYTDEEGYRVVETIYHYDNASFVLKAQVDAVQTHNAQDAFMSAWGVLAEFDANGNITALQ